MSFGIAVFDPSVAPGEQNAFKSWFAEQTELVRASHGNATPACAALRDWHAEMRRIFPGLNGADAAGKPEPDEAAGHVTECLFGQHVICMGFGRPINSEARKAILRSASLLGIGVYDVANNRIFRPNENKLPQIRVRYAVGAYAGLSTLTLYETLDIFEGQTWDKGAFIELPLGRTHLFQINGEFDGKLSMELRGKKNRDSFSQKLADKDACREMLRAAFGKEDLDPGMREYFSRLLTSRPNTPASRPLLGCVCMAVLAALTYLAYTLLKS